MWTLPVFSQAHAQTTTDLSEVTEEDCRVQGGCVICNVKKWAIELSHNEEDDILSYLKYHTQIWHQLERFWALREINETFW